jgi:hypothetical protein
MNAFSGGKNDAFLSAFFGCAGRVRAEASSRNFGCVSFDCFITGVIVENCEG